MGIRNCICLLCLVPFGKNNNNKNMFSLVNINQCSWSYVLPHFCMECSETWYTILIGRVDAGVIFSVPLALGSAKLSALGHMCI